jgi:sugar transferase (PEP-CTERM/EpsH1 system associated)
MTGGLENGLVNLINHMPESRFRHAVACVEDYSDFRNRIVRPDVEVYALHRSRIGVWGLRRELFHLCRRLRPALIHSRNMSGLDALLPARAAGVRHCVHGEHGWDVDNLDGKKWKPALLRRIHSPLVDRYVTVSKDLARYLVGRVGVRSSRICQVYNGVDTERFKPGTRTPDGLMPAGFADEGTVVIGTVGRLQPIKDQATLIRAFAALLKEYPDVGLKTRLAVVGDGPLSADLHALAEQLGASKQIWFAGDVRNVPDVLRNFDLFVLPSLSEGISNTILEAMATGVPVLASAVGGNVELIDDGHTGRLFQAGDVDYLMHLLAAYGSNVTMRRTHGKAARRVALECFSLAKMVRNYQTIYEDLCFEGSLQTQFPD